MIKRQAFALAKLCGQHRSTDCAFYRQRLHFAFQGTDGVSLRENILGFPIAIHIPGYSIVRELGRGGMATVYLALQQSLNREVALKVLAPALAQDRAFAERFVRESRIAGGFRHRHLIAVVDAGQLDNQLYLAMEYVPGGTAESLRGGDTDEIYRCLKEIAAALAYAHARGVVHRDIKPENILRREDGSYVLSDFGIARSAEHHEKLTAPQVALGTPAYMSPEQWRGERIDGRADLYSLGMVLFEFLTGRAPFHEGDSWAIGMQHMKAPRPRLPPELASWQPLLDRLTSAEPGNRYASADALCAALASLGPPTAIKPESRLGVTSQPNESSSVTVELALPDPVQGQATELIRPNAVIRHRIWLVPAILSLAFAAYLFGGWWPAPSLEASRSMPAASTPAAKSIAVLRFVNMSSDPETEYFADGIAEEILNQLAQLKNLRVAGRTSSFSFKGSNQDLRLIGERLGVAYVLEGSVRKAATQVRITVKLVQAKDGFEVWSRAYDRELSDIFKVQDEISQSVLQAMKANVLGERPLHVATTSIEAYNLHLQAQSNLFKRGAENMQAARAQFEAALALDPDYVPSLVGLARTLAFLPSYQALSGEETNTIIAAAAGAAEHALQLDPENAGAYSVLGFIRSVYQWRWSEAESLIARSLELAPNDAEIANIAGDYYVTTLDTQNSIAMNSRAVELNPLYPVNNWEFGIAYASFGNFEQAIVHASRGQALTPETFRPYFVLVWAHGALGQFDQARATIATARKNTHEAEFRYTALEAWAAIAEQQPQTATRLLAELEPFAAREELSRAYLGYCYLLLGDSDKAAYWLQEALRVRDFILISPEPLDLSRIAADPKTRVIFADQGLQALLDIRIRNNQKTLAAP